MIFLFSTDIGFEKAVRSLLPKFELDYDLLPRLTACFLITYIIEATMLCTCTFFLMIMRSVYYGAYLFSKMNLNCSQFVLDFLNNHTKNNN